MLSIYEHGCLKLNFDKTDVLLVVSSLVLGNGNIPVLDSVILMMKAHVHSLGIFLDPALLMDV